MRISKVLKKYLHIWFLTKNTKEVNMTNHDQQNMKRVFKVFWEQIIFIVHILKCLIFSKW
jgi:hypothetical protein